MVNGFVQTELITYFWDISHTSQRGIVSGLSENINTFLGFQKGADLGKIDSEIYIFLFIFAFSCGKTILKRGKSLGSPFTIKHF